MKEQIKQPSLYDCLKERQTETEKEMKEQIKVPSLYDCLKERQTETER